MLTVSFRMKGKKIFSILAALVIVIAAGFGVKSFFFGEINAEETAITLKQQQKIQKSNSAKSNEDRIEFIGSFGWEVVSEPLEVKEIIIPKTFDDVYSQYNEMQKDSGYDLTKLSGKRCKRYAYTVTNYPDADGDVLANLIVYKDKVVGGDISSAKLDGFIHGFKH